MSVRDAFLSKYWKSSLFGTVAAVFMLAVVMQLCGADEFSTFHSTGASGGRADWIYPAEEPRRIEAVHDIITPHIPMATPLAGEPIKILAIANKDLGRWPLEIAQRLETDMTVVYADTQTQLGAQAVGSVQQQQIDIEARIVSELNRQPQIIISDIMYSAYGDEVQQRLSENISGGAAYIGHLEGMDLTGYENDRQTVLKIFQRCVPFAGLDALKAEYDSLEAAAASAISLYRKAGSGVLIDIWTWPRDEHRGSELLLYDYLPRMERECWYAMLLQNILYAADRISLTSRTSDIFAANVDRDSMPLRAGRLPFQIEQSEAVHCEVWDANGRKVFETSVTGEETVSGSLKIAQLPAGDYFVLIRHLTSQDKVLDFRLSHLTVNAQTEIAQIALDDRYLDADETAQALIQLDSQPDQGSKLLVETIDNFGRVIYQRQMPAERSVTIDADTARSLHLYNYINVKLLDHRGNVVSENRESFFINHPPGSTDELTVKMWLSGSSNPRVEFLNWKHARDLVDAGLIGAHRGSTETEGIENLARLNLRASLWEISVRGPQVSSQGVRSPDLSDPSYISATGGTLRRQAEVFRRYSPYSYSLGDDQNFLSPGMDAGWSESNRQSFANWLQQRYQSIEQLNERWATDYDTFSQVEPIRLADAVAMAFASDSPEYGGLAHWIDHQLHQEEMVVRWHGLMRESIKEADPQTRVAMGNTIHYPSPNTGFNYWLIGQTLDEIGAYPHRMTHDLYRSARGQNQVHGMYSGGYGVYNRIPYYAMKLYPWYAVFHDINALFYWHGSTAGAWNYGRVIAPDLGPVYGYKDSLESVHQLKSGIARMLYDAERLDNQIKVLYSPGSVDASAFIVPLPDRTKPTNLGMSMLGGIDPSSLIDPLPKPAAWERSWAGADNFVAMQSWEGITHLLNDIGFSYEALSADALSDETLNLDEVKMLVLPLTLWLTERQADIISDFVRDGGIVVADLAAGVFDENMRPGSPGTLSDVFGVSYRQGMPPQHFALEEITVNQSKWQQLGLNMPEKLSLEKWMIYQGLELDGADSLAHAQTGTPAITVNEYGQGKAIMLNMLARDYALWRTLGREMPFRQAAQAVLAQAGLEPVVKAQVYHSGGGVGYRPLQATQIIRWQQGRMEFVGMLRDFAMRWDESVFMSDLRPHVAEVDFGRESHVYDVRNGTYRGFRQIIDTTVYPAEAKLYALMPYEVIRIDGESNYDTADSSIQINAQTIISSGNSPVQHTFHLQVVDPLGRSRREYDANVQAPQGKYRGSIFLGYSPEAGIWQVTITDATTGIKKRWSVDVQPDDTM